MVFPLINCACDISNEYSNLNKLSTKSQLTLQFGKDMILPPAFADLLNVLESGNDKRSEFLVSSFKKMRRIVRSFCSNCVAGYATFDIFSINVPCSLILAGLLISFGKFELSFGPGKDGSVLVLDPLPKTAWSKLIMTSFPRMNQQLCLSYIIQRLCFIFSLLRSGIFPPNLSLIL